jgi:hypothetical protein
MQLRFPVLSQGQRKALEDSIARYGIQYPVLALPDGRIIDGFNRWEITQGDCPVQFVDRAEDDAVALGIALNMARRHLTPEQIADVRKRLDGEQELQRKTAVEMRRQGLTQQEVAERLGVTRQTIDNWENENSANACNAFVPEPPDCRTTVARADNWENESVSNTTNAFVPEPLPQRTRPHWKCVGRG